MKNVKENSKADKRIRITIAISLIVFEVTYYYYFLVMEKYRELDIIPFTVFCAMTNILTVYYLLTNNKKMANIVFYYGLTGSVLAILFVNITSVPPHFRFMHYFYNHFMFMLVAIYGFVIGRVKIERKVFNKAVKYLVIYALLLLVVNYSLDQNFFYFKESPLKGISDFLGPVLYPICWMAAIYLLLNIRYFLFKYLSKFKKDKEVFREEQEFYRELAIE